MKRKSKSRSPPRKSRAFAIVTVFANCLSSAPSCAGISRPRSDVDVLVEFEKGQSVGLIRLAGIERELSELLGRQVDLNTRGFLSPWFRDQVLKEAEDQYVAP